MGYTFQFSVVWNNFGLFLQGVFLTVQLTLIAIFLGLVVGIVGAAFRTSGNRFLDGLAVVYVEFIRNTPFLIQLLFVFFGLPSIGLRLSAEQAAILALTVNFGAYATEIFRAGLEGIRRGQIEAGLALGFKKLQIFRLILLKPAIANIYPSLITQVVLLLLLTSIVSQISAEELTFVGSFIDSRTFRSVEIYFTITLIYLGLTWLIKLIAYFIHRRFFKFAQYL